MQMVRYFMPDKLNQKLSYNIWEKSEFCPHCGHDSVEITFDADNEWFDCLNCDRVSAHRILTKQEREMSELADNIIWDYYHSGET